MRLHKKVEWVAAGYPFYLLGKRIKQYCVYEHNCQPIPTTNMQNDAKDHTPYSATSQPEKSGRKMSQKIYSRISSNLMYSSFHKLYIITLVDRRSRFLLTGISKTKKPAEVTQVMGSMLEGLPSRLLQSRTPTAFSASIFLSTLIKCPSLQSFWRSSHIS